MQPRRLARFVRLEQAIAILLVGTTCGKFPGNPFKLGHHLEHLDDLLGRWGRHNRPAPRPRNDEAGSGELQQSFSDGGSRYPIAGGKPKFVQPSARPKHTLGDFLFDDVAKPRSGVGRSHGAFFSAAGAFLTFTPEMWIYLAGRSSGAEPGSESGLPKNFVAA